MSKNYSLIVLMLVSGASAAAPATRPAASLRPMSRPAPDYRTLYNKSQTELAQALARITALEEQVQSLAEQLDRAAIRDARDPGRVVVVAPAPSGPGNPRYRGWSTADLQELQRARTRMRLSTDEVDAELARRRAREATVNRMDGGQ